MDIPSLSPESKAVYATRNSPDVTQVLKAMDDLNIPKTWAELLRFKLLSPCWKVDRPGPSIKASAASPTSKSPQTTAAQKLSYARVTAGAGEPSSQEATPSVESSEREGGVSSTVERELPLTAAAKKEYKRIVAFALKQAGKAPAGGKKPGPGFLSLTVTTMSTEDVLAPVIRMSRDIGALELSFTARYAVYEWQLARTDGGLDAPFKLDSEAALETMVVPLVRALVNDLRYSHGLAVGINSQITLPYGKAGLPKTSIGARRNAYLDVGANRIYSESCAVSRTQYESALLGSTLELNSRFVTEGRIKGLKLPLEIRVRSSAQPYFLFHREKGTTPPPSDSSSSERLPSMDRAIVTATTALQPWAYGAAGNTTGGMLFDGSDFIAVSSQSDAPHRVKMRLVQDSQLRDEDGEASESSRKWSTKFLRKRPPRSRIADKESGEEDYPTYVSIRHHNDEVVPVSWLAYFLARLHQSLQNAASLQYDDHAGLINPR